MSLIDHQQAAIQAAKDALAVHQIGEDWGDDGISFVGCDCGQWFGKRVNDGKELARTHEAQSAITAAAPHLRAGIAEEVRDLRSQFHDDAKTAFGRIGSSTEAYLNALDDVLALLRRSTND